MDATKESRRRKNLYRVAYHEVGHAVIAATYGHFWSVVIIPTANDDRVGGCVLASRRAENSPDLSTEALILINKAGMEAERIYLGRPQLGRLAKGDLGYQNQDKAGAELLAASCCNNPTGTKHYLREMRAKVKSLLQENWSAVETASSEVIKMVDSGVRTAGGNVKYHSERIQEIVEVAFKEKVA